MLPAPEIGNHGLLTCQIFQQYSDINTVIHIESRNPKALTAVGYNVLLAHILAGFAWSKWRETTGVMCDRNIPTKLKDKVYKTAIKPAMVYGAECWAVRKKEERKLHTTEMRMLRWARGKTRLDHVRNVDIWNEAHMYPMAEFLRENRLRWFGHVQRRDKDDATRKILQMEVEGKRNRGRPKLRWRDLVKDDMARNQMTTEMAEDRRHWHVMVRAGTLRRVEADR